jgi:PAS domain S-box-containing protein
VNHAAPPASAYGEALAAFLADADEDALARAWELGRRAAADGSGVLDVVALHHAVLPELVPGAGTGVADALRRAGAFLAEALSPFEMTHRAFRDACVDLERLNGELVDARQQVQDALRASEARFRRLAESGIVGLFVTGGDGAVLDANEAFLRLVGADRRSLARGVLSESGFTPARWTTASAQARATLVATGIAPPREQELLRVDGALVPVLLCGALLEDGTSLHVVADLTDRRRAEEALRRAEEQLRQAQKMEALGRLAGGVAHDFNNILTAILGFGRMLLDDADAEHAWRPSLEAIVRAGERASDLTEQLLAFSRRQVLQPKVVDLDEAVRSMVPMLRRLVGADVAFEVDTRVPHGAVFLDPGHVEQVVLNLVVNARDALPDGGRVRVTTDEVVVDGEAGDTELAPGRWLVIAVQDDGVGMDEATRSQIFEPFFTTKEGGRGTGLGLATVQGIAAQAGGAVRVDSEPGRGTTFRVWLPRVDPEPPPVSEPTARGAGGHETVLVVEDDDAVRDFVVTVLRRHGHRVLQAPDGARALAIGVAHAGAIDLLLTDVVMPGMSGRELAARFAQFRPATRVLFMSGYTDDAVLKTAAFDATIAFLQKPLRPEQLLARVREVLGRA